MNDKILVWNKYQELTHKYFELCCMQVLDEQYPGKLDKLADEYESYGMVEMAGLCRKKAEHYTNIL